MKNLVIITVAPKGTLGDASAAVRLRQALINQSVVREEESLKINIIIFVEGDHLTALQKTFDMSYCTPVVYNKTRLLPILQKKHLDLIIVYPTPHMLNMQDKLDIEKLKVPVICSTEYNFDAEHYYEGRNLLPYINGSIYMPTGFGRACYGVFTDIVHKPSTEAIPQDESTLSLPKLITGLGERFYFGYFNDLVFSRSRANPAMFIGLASGICPDKEVHVILPLRLRGRASKISMKDHLSNTLNHDDIRQLVKNGKPVSFSFYSEDSEPLYFVMTSDSMKISLIGQDKFEEIKDHCGKVIHLYDPFPLKKEHMQLLMQRSQPLCLLTGDQSLVEGILNKKHICYQTMPWKEKLQSALINEVTKWPVLHEWFELIASPTTGIHDLTEFYTSRKEKLDSDCLEFSRHVVDGFSLESRFYTKVHQLLNGNIVFQFQQALSSFLVNPQFFLTQIGNFRFNTPTLTRIQEFIQPFLEQASPDQRQEMVDYLVKRYDDIAAFIKEYPVYLCLEIKRMYPEIQFNLKPEQAFLSLEIVPSTIKETVNSDPRNPFYAFKDNGEVEDKGLDTSSPSTNVSELLDIVSLTNWDEFDLTHKKKLLTMLSQQPQYYEIGIHQFGQAENLFIHILNHEKDPDIMQLLIKTLVATPCYEDVSEELRFNHMRPNLLMQLSSAVSETIFGIICSDEKIQPMVLETIFNPKPAYDSDGEPAHLSTFVIEALFLFCPQKPKRSIFSETRGNSNLHGLLEEMPEPYRKQLLLHLQQLKQYNPHRYSQIEHGLPKWASEDRQSLTRDN